jgi:hypothetical protein
MIRIKTITQSVNTYEVDEVLQADFLRELARNKPSVQNHQVDGVFINEIIIDIYRIPEFDSSRSTSEDSTSPASARDSNSDQYSR